METLDFKLSNNININFFKPIIMEASFYILVVACLLIAGALFFVLPRLLKSEKNILLKVKNKYLGEFEYHQKDN